MTKISTKRRLIKSPKYLFFDLGIRRACANEGTRLSQKMLADLVCRTPNKYRIAENIWVLPWQEIPTIFAG